MEQESQKGDHPLQLFPPLLLSHSPWMLGFALLRWSLFVLTQNDPKHRSTSPHKRWQTLGVGSQVLRTPDTSTNHWCSSRALLIKPQYPWRTSSCFLCPFPAADPKPHCGHGAAPSQDSIPTRVRAQAPHGTPCHSPGSLLISEALFEILSTVTDGPPYPIIITAQNKCPAGAASCQPGTCTWV